MNDARFPSTAAESLHYDRLRHPLLGIELTITWSRQGLTAITQAEPPAELMPAPVDAYRQFPALRRIFEEGESILTASLPVALGGTDFQRAVWARIARIPFGETISYAELAADLGKPDAVRAVGAACGRNPLPLAIPCHRVLTRAGGLGGFLWGLPAKRALLDRESNLLLPRAA